ncbi:MsnO8 family LLM class oxidoreductase [Rosenbergiella epipactidis]|uniref:MsnO8 family LLM class oxidoreductase n=1 Tax=Rosenbergiella epipactidis TaxID=1544694 RepID=UPI0020264FED|nr:MsnO8 family LLM class oxidoreductase [Rosenbergiella epipactidis]MCL9669341.1 MsnO8 family LLM class oxidoreductase [Rosenbergiella epipactidis]
MPFRLSILDKCPRQPEETSQQALQNTLALARLAEQAGYYRYWIAEHHNTPALASPSPEIVLAWLAAQTKTLRLGAGGVMLQHYSPYKVAENFHLLAAVAPGRIDLGVGKAPGGLPISTRALQGQAPGQHGSFAQQLADVNRYLTQADPKLQATPLPAISPPRFLLGASQQSAELAHAVGWNFVFAAHLNGDDQQLAKVTDFWQQQTQRPTLVAVQVVIAANRAQADALAASLETWQLVLENGQRVNLASSQQAQTFAQQAASGIVSLERKYPTVIAGSGEEVFERLVQLHRRYQIDEFIIDLPITDPAHRQQALTRLAAARQAAHYVSDRLTISGATP